MNESTNKSCCGFFIDTLNKLTSSKNILKLKFFFKPNDNELVEQDFVVNNDLTVSDVDSFLTYCTSWQQKHCVCIFSKDDLIEKFHHFLHQIICLSVLVIKNLSNNGPDENAATEANIHMLSSSIDVKEKLLCSLIKVLSPNMPLYITYKHLMHNNPGRYSQITECSCCNLSQDSLNLIQIYCNTSQDLSPANKSLNQDLENLPVEFLRNICHFVDLYGLLSIKECFSNDQSVNLPLSLVHLLFNIIVNIRFWLNPSFVEQQILSIRPLAIKYMCSLCDKELRMAGTRNTIDLMHESFKLPSLNSYINQTSDSSRSSSSSDQTSQENCTFEFKIDLDGLKLAHKYLTSNTLTIRLSGVAQMNLQINAWSEFNSLNSVNLRNKAIKNELADWFVQNNIIEYLYGPNLHHELIKRSQDIVNFLAFTNRLTEKHLDAMWASAQLKYCSKSVMETLISLIKHLDINSVKYLSKLISRLDLDKQTDQTLFLSALLTKNQWCLMLQFDDPRLKMLNKSESDVSQKSVNLSLKKIRPVVSSSDENEEKITSKRLRQRRQTVNSYVNNVEENEESEDEDYEESEEEDERQEGEEDADSDESENTDDLDIEVERVNSGLGICQRGENYESSQDGLSEELIRIEQLNEENNRLKKENGCAYVNNVELESHSSNVSSASSVKNFNDVDQESGDDEITDSKLETNCIQIPNSSFVNTFECDLIMNGVRLSNSTDNQDETNSQETSGLNLNDLCEPGNTFLWDLLMNQTEQIHQTHSKIIKEAEKQFQIIICLPNTDRRIKFKFIESFIKSMHKPFTCPIALRLLTKIFSSFEKYTTSSFNFVSEFNMTKKMHPTKPITEIHKSLFCSTQSPNLYPSIEIHKIVALADFKFDLISQFFTSLNSLETSKDQHMQIQARLQFLSFIYSTVGSLDAFDLSEQNVNDLWSCLNKFEQSSEIKDDIFNWFLLQAKNKDQHAVNIDSFELIFEKKMPFLEPNSFSLPALHLYQELFKIYKSNSAENEDSKQMEQSAIDHMLKLAFKSKQNEVSLSAIQFLNSHHSSNEGEFVEKCLGYLQESRRGIEDGDTIETNLIEIQRGLLLLKNHLDLSQRKNSYRIRLMQLKEPKYLNHSKCLIDYETSDALIRFVCRVNSTRFNFELVMTMGDCVGDLKAVVREILLNCIKSGKEMSADERARYLGQAADFHNDEHKLLFNSNNLNDNELCKNAYSNLIQGNQNTEMLKNVKLIHTLIEKEEVLYIKLFSNGQELITESKLLSELGLKDNQIIHVTLFSKSVVNQTNSMTTRLEPDTLPLVILSREDNFKSLFKLLNLLVRVSGEQLDPMVRKKICHLSHKCWKIINTLPSSASLLALIKESKDFSLSELHQELLNRTHPNQDDLTKSLSFELPYQLLYFIQLVEITLSSIDLQKDKKNVTCTIYIYKIARLLTNYLSTNDQTSSMLKFDVKLDCLSILLNILNRCLLEQSINNFVQRTQTPKKKLKKNSGLFDKLNYHPSHVRLDLFMSILFPDNNLNSFITFILNVQCLSSLSESDSSLNILNQSMKLLIDLMANENLTSRLTNDLIDIDMREQRLNWLKSLLLCSKSDSYRHDTATWLHRLCLFDDKILSIILDELIEHITFSAQYRPSSQQIACKEYFELISKLLSGQTKTMIYSKLMHIVTIGLESRDIYETLSLNSPSFVEDNFLVGILLLGCELLKNKLIDHDLDENLNRKLMDYLFSTRDELYPRVELPKLRSVRSRELGFEFLLEICKYRPKNYSSVVNRLIKLHESNQMVMWDYWPRDDVRSIYGYLGLVNLGATCYMATSLQHLFMIKEVRQLILESNISQTQVGQCDTILMQVKQIFAFLQESERKAYSPKDLCKVYTMDQQALNTGEQKDMQEFFTDLISKLEETSDPVIKSEIKKLFGGVITNVVISLDCPHVSSSLEEFYTVRCQVSGMNDLYESLNEITVKDTLEGDNMYTCSTCSKKVRAEKRACFKQLPQVLCLNTMRYTFNMVTMLKEKVNTYFSFPLELNMSGYMEQNLIENKLNAHESNEEFVYDLIGVTVHTGTADGGHYYSFIQEIGESSSDKPKWFLFNDAEVKQFDVDSQLASECFGGETFSKAYDSHHDKYTDLSYEKTNSAYMLFYKKRSTFDQSSTITTRCNDQTLLDQIWIDNIKLITDRLIFENCYFNFVFKLADFGLKSASLTLYGAQLAITFFLETFIHSREKHHMIQWIDLLDKLFSHKQTCEWLVSRLSTHVVWLRKILVKCPQISIRLAFQKFLLGIAQKCDWFILRQFLSAYVSLMSEKNPIRYMSEYFVFLTEYSRLGEQQNLALLELNVAKLLCLFYMRNRSRDSHQATHADSDNSDFSVDNLDSDSDSDNDIVALNDQRSKPKVFEKVLVLLVQLTESYLLYVHKNYQLKQLTLLIKIPLVFFYKTILDGLNLQLVKQLLVNSNRLRVALCSHFVPDVYVQKFLNMCVKSIGLLEKKNTERDKYMNFFNAMSFLLSLDMERVCDDDIECALCEQTAIDQNYSHLLIDKIQNLFELAPFYTLNWLTGLGSEPVEEWLLDNMSIWLKQMLIDAKQTQVRFSAAVLLVNLVPDADFRHEFTSSNRNMLSPYKPESGETNEKFLLVVNRILSYLFSLMHTELIYSTDSEQYQSTHLIQYFTLLIYFLMSSDQKRLCIQNQTLDIFWQRIFYKHMANSHVSTNLNKQLMSHFIYHCLNECPQVLDYVCQYGSDKFEHTMATELPLCTVIVDHEDADLINYNKQCLHPFYASIRLLCQHSAVYMRHMCQHSNLQWAFKHVLPYSTLYPLACLELVKLVDLLSRESAQLKESLCTQFLMSPAIEAKKSFQSIVWVIRTLMRSSDDVTLVLTRRGLSTISICFFQLVAFYNNSQEAQLQDINDCLALLKSLVQSVSAHLDAHTDGIEQIIANWKEKFELIKRLVIMINFSVPTSTRTNLIDLIRLILELNPIELTANTLAILKQSHSNLNYYQTCNLVQKGSIMSDKPTCNSLHKCYMNNQSVNQAVSSMGAHFPVPGSFVLGVKKLNAAFNLYLPLSHINHCHYDGCVFMMSKIVGHLTDYERNLRDSYTPLFDFYHFLFKRLLDQLTSLNEQHTKNLIDLVLIVSTQSMYFNVHFIGYLSQRADGLLSERIGQSAHLANFMRVLFTDYRHFVSRDEYASFIAEHTGRYMHSLVSLTNSQLAKANTFSRLLSQTIKNIIRLSLASINEIRFFFEFNADNLNDECVHNMDLKRSCIIGSIKCVHVIASRVSECKVDKPYVKFVKQLKEFFESYWEHVNKQSEEMAKYLDDTEGHRSKKVKLDENDGGDMRARLESKRKCAAGVAQALRQIVELMDSLVQGLGTMGDQSSDETSDESSSTTSSSSQEASTESGSHNENESTSEQEISNA